MSDSRFGRAFALFFPLPFALVGVGALGAAAARLARGDDPVEAGGLALFGLVFAAAGFGLWALFRWTRSRRTRVDELRRRHPDEPWMWRPEWAAGRIPGSNRARMGVAWTFAFFWNALSAPAVPEGYRRLSRGFEAETLLLLAFPAVGVALLVWGLGATWRWRRFGRAHFVPDSLPVPTGGRLAGTVVVGSRMRAANVTLTLTCLRRSTRGSGDNRTVHESILWQGTQRLDRFDLRIGGGEVRIPVDIPLPRDARPSDPVDGESCVLWRLAARAELPTIDWTTDFEVPVFGPAGGAVTAYAGATGDAGDSGLAPPAPSADRRSRVRVERTADGLAVEFPAARNVGAILALVGFLAVWTGLVVFLAGRGHATWFTAVFGLFDLILLTLLGHLLFLHRAVRVDPTSATVTTRWLAFSRTRRVDCEALSAVRTRIGMQSNNRPYYDVLLVGLDGTTIVAGTDLADKDEAEWIAGELREAAGLMRREGPPVGRRRAAPRHPAAGAEAARTGQTVGEAADVSRSA